jgi:hypothetical protein
MWGSLKKDFGEFVAVRERSTTNQTTLLSLSLILEGC